MFALQTKSLIKIYGQKNSYNVVNALKGVDLNVQEGEFIGIMGPSGSGKSTLLNILGGIDKPTSGSVKIMDKSIEDMSKDELALFRRSNLGFIFQDFNLMDSLTVKENVMLPMVLNKESSITIEKKTESILKFFDIYEIKDKYPYNISGGQQQRTAAARAVVNEPKVIMADEPTGNLDSKSSYNVMTTLKNMNEKLKSTIVMVTHDSFAASFCSRVVFIKDGEIDMEIISKGDRKEFFDRIIDCIAVNGGERK